MRTTTKQKNEPFVVCLNKDVSRTFTTLCKENGTTIFFQVEGLAARIIEDERVPFKVNNEMVTCAKDTSNGNDFTFRFTDVTQEAFAAACKKAGITRQTLIRLYMLKCVKENRLVLGV